MSRARALRNNRNQHMINPGMALAGGPLGRRGTIHQMQRLHARAALGHGMDPAYWTGDARAAGARAGLIPHRGMGMGMGMYGQPHQHPPHALRHRGGGGGGGAGYPMDYYDEPWYDDIYDDNGYDLDGYFPTMQQQRHCRDLPLRRRPNRGNTAVQQQLTHLAHAASHNMRQQRRNELRVHGLREDVRQLALQQQEDRYEMEREMHRNRTRNRHHNSARRHGRGRARHARFGRNNEVIYLDDDDSGSYSDSDSSFDSDEFEFDGRDERDWDFVNVRRGLRRGRGHSRGHSRGRHGHGRNNGGRERVRVLQMPVRARR